MASEADSQAERSRGGRLAALARRTGVWLAKGGRGLWRSLRPYQRSTRK